MKTAYEDGLDEFAVQWQQQGIDRDLMPMKLVGRILRLMKIIEGEISRCHENFGLKQGEFDVLATLRRSGEPFSLTPSQLYQSMLLSSGAMTNRLDRLEQKGLIARQHSEEDRRSVLVSLTSTGKALIEDALPRHFDTMQRLVSGVMAEDREQLAALLRHWLHDLDK